MRNLLPVVIVCAGLCGCGQRGPLYLPEPPDQQTVPAPPPPSAIDETAPEEDADESVDES
jgi:predicted small lipoprotein YifL